MIVDCAAASDIGGRHYQEDAVLTASHLDLFAVADGMGASMSARPAADLALATLRSRYAGDSIDDDAAHLAGAVQAANAAVFEKTDGSARAFKAHSEGRRSLPSNEDLSWLGAGTTLVALRLAANQAFIAHVGDSRAYLRDAAGLRRLTTDHRLREEALRAGYPESKVLELPHAVVTRALGVGATVEVSITSVPATPGCLFLLCTDGLTDALEDAEIKAILDEHASDLDACAEALVQRAAKTGRPRHGHTDSDNVAVILLRVR